MSLDPKSFTVSVTDKITGETLRGTFRVKTRLSHRDQLARERIRLELLGPLASNATVRAKDQAEIFSELSVRIIDAPQFWKDSDNGLDLEDDSIVITVYNESLKAQKDAIDALQKEGEAAKADLAKLPE